jgi:glycosyltransferase involved in cell wall biosynthesis
MATLPGDVHAVFAGEGDLRDALGRRARALGIAPRIHLMGHRDDVPRILRSVDVFCLPSRQEGLGTSVLDAMAAGTPVVATRGGGIPEMVEEGRSGLLVPRGEPIPLGDTLARVLADEALRRRLIQGGRARVREFSVDRMVEGTLEVYGQVTAFGRVR